MGVQIKDILEYEEISINTINNKKIAIDSFNMLYQFLASIRQSDGNPLTDSKGNITSHLKGLFNRCVYFKKNNIKPIFVFDGEAPKLKEKERELRRKKRSDADKKHKNALDVGDLDEAKKFSYQILSRLTDEMIDDSKELIKAFGFVAIDAPSEGEAQGAHFVNKGLAWALSSQDFDSLLFGAKHLIRNLSVSNRRKVPGSSVYKEVPIEMYDIEKNLKKLGITRDELIIIAILCGTDFNPGGIKGIGPKKALKLVREYKDRWEEIFKVFDWFSYFPYPWIEVFNTFKHMPVKDIDDVKFSDIDKQRVKKILMNSDFEEDMLDRSLKGIKKIQTLDKFF